MLLPWRVNLADQFKVNNNRKKRTCVSRTIHGLSVWNTPLIDTCQYCSTSWANQALSSLANAGFQTRGVCLQAFPPPPPPPFSFWFSFNFSRDQNRKSPSTVFVCSETKRNSCYAGYQRACLEFLNDKCCWNVPSLLCGYSVWNRTLYNG